MKAASIEIVRVYSLFSLYQSLILLFYLALSSLFFYVLYRRKLRSNPQLESGRYKLLAGGVPYLIFMTGIVISSQSKNTFSNYSPLMEWAILTFNWFLNCLCAYGLLILFRKKRKN
jgi:hypothetical protein